MSEKFLHDLPFSDAGYSAVAPSNYKLAPWDGSLTLPEIYDWHLTHNPRKTLFIYENQLVGYTHLTFQEIIPASHHAASWVASAISVPLNAVPASTPPVAIIATSDTITHFCTLLGMMKAGISYITISPHNSPAAVVHLAEKVKSEYVLHSSEPSIIKLVHDASELMLKDHSRSLKSIRMPEFGDIFREGPYPTLAKRRYELDFPAIYTHSSGSTSFPKPIPWTHAFLMQCALAPVLGAANFCNEVVAYHSASMSHGTGVHLIPYLAASGMVVAVFPPSTPAKYPTPEATYQAFAKVKADYVITFPNMLETWSTDPAKVDGLRKAKGVLFTGSMLNKQRGDAMASKGVRIFTFYGMAEAGVIGAWIPENQGMDWEYFPLTQHSGGKFVDGGDDLYELVIVEQQYKRLPISNMKLGEARAYATRDSFVEHPTKPGYWRVCGRFDDRITHPNGEKTNPVMMEQIIGTDPQVKSAIVFGNGRNQTGVLIQLKDEFVFDPADQDKLSTFRKYILPKINEANSIAATYSRIFPEMIMVTSPFKPFMYTEKGSLRRGAILKSYTDEIDELYKSVEQGLFCNVPLPSDWTSENTLSFVQAVLRSLSLEVPEAEDIFRYGCNSIQATRIEIIIRNSLKQALGPKPEINTLRNFIYELQTPRAIADFLSSLINTGGTQASAESNSYRRMKEMEELLLPLTSNFAAPTSAQDSDSTRKAEAVILVTGTTGALGSNFLATIIEDTTVARIYAINRFLCGVAIAERQKETFVQQGLDPQLLSHPKVSLLEGDLTKQYFDLDPTTFEEMRATVTHVCHFAWDINWVVPVTSFQSQLKGLRNLIDFALSSRMSELPAFVYASSIGVFRNVPPENVIPEHPLPDLANAAGQGYSESKAIAERVLEAAAAHTPLRPTIVRFGQISGGKSGAWSIKEWLPTLLRSSVTIGILPDLQGVASFLPADDAARVVNEVRDKRIPVLHVSHPKPVPFRGFSELFAESLGLPIVPYTEWVQTVERLEDTLASSPEELSQVPALKILDFFREAGRYPDRAHSEVFGLVTLDTAVATSLSPTLNHSPQLGSEDAKKWLEYWKGIGFI